MRRTSDNRRSVRTAVLAGLVALATAHVGSYSRFDPFNDTARFLQTDIGLTTSDLATLAKNDPVVRLLDKQDKRDVAVFGVVPVGVTPDFFISQFRDIRSFKTGRFILQIGTFSNPPQPGDLATLTFEHGDLEALWKCRPGDCDVRLSAGDIQGLQSARGRWLADARRNEADDWWRRMLLGYATEYLSRGDAALTSYADQKESLSLSSEYRALVQASPSLGPSPFETPMDGADTFLYWSKEAFGLKPVITLTYVTIWRTTDESGAIRTLIVSKQIYASHYLDSSLAMTALVPTTPRDGRASTYVMYLNRSRTALPGGLLGALARQVIQRRTVDGMREQLLLTRNRLETGYGP